MKLEKFKIPRVGMLYEYARFDRNNSNKKYSEIKLVNTLYKTDNEILKDIPFEELGFKGSYYNCEIAEYLDSYDFSMFKNIFNYDEETVNYIKEVGKGYNEFIVINDLRDEFIFVKYCKVLIVGDCAYPLPTDNCYWLGGAKVVDCPSEDY